MPTVYPGVVGGSTMPITPDLFTVAEAAAMLGIQPGTLRSAIHNGTITPVRIDARTNAIHRDELERYRRESLGKPGPRGPRKKPQSADEPTHD